MFEQMIDGSIGALIRPSVTTFEQHKRNALSWAFVYMGIAAVLAAVCAAIGHIVRAPMLEQQLQQSPLQLDNNPFLRMIMAPSLEGTIITGLVFPLISFLLSTTVVYGLSRAFGGSGNFGELAYTMALFAAPLTFFMNLISIVAVNSLLSCLSSLASLTIMGYYCYLTYVGIQPSMQLPKQKASYVVWSFVGLGILLGVSMMALLIFMLAQAMPRT